MHWGTSCKHKGMRKAASLVRTESWRIVEGTFADLMVSYSILPFKEGILWLLCSMDDQGLGFQKCSEGQGVGEPICQCRHTHNSYFIM